MNHLRDLEQWATGMITTVTKLADAGCSHYCIMQLTQFLTTRIKERGVGAPALPVVRKSDISKDYARFLSMSHEREISSR